MPVLYVCANPKCDKIICAIPAEYGKIGLVEFGIYKSGYY